MVKVKYIKDFPKQPIEIFIEKLFNELKIDFRKVAKFTFFYRPLNDVDALIHIIIIVSYVIIGLRLSGVL